VKPLVIIIMGSPMDRDYANTVATALGRLGVEVVQRIGSAQRTPQHVLSMARAYDAEQRPKVFITIAGLSNALSGLIDPQVKAPVIACPPTGPLEDVWSSLRQPPGVAPGVVLDPMNAAMLAAKILALTSPELAETVELEHERHRSRISVADRDLNEGWHDD
jgi:5-(carboxyamino)imidazole ribonucleotide mutase/phosphoribosylaminoimidazole-succinocarboxamide synthase